MSCSLTSRSLPLSLGSGAFPKGGETNISEVGFLSAMNSLNPIRMFGLLKWIDEFGGSQLRTLGGVVSLGPPSGETGLAHRLKNTRVAIRRMTDGNVLRSTDSVCVRGFVTPNLPIVFDCVTFFLLILHC